VEDDAQPADDVLGLPLVGVNEILEGRHGFVVLWVGVDKVTLNYSLITGHNIDTSDNHVIS
jgi:hypothetical protein